jgi:flagellar hook assembly protein FlgD
LQTDGKIILAGKANTGNWDVALIRVNTDGTQDNFGIFGIVTTNFGGDDVGNAVAIQADGKIVMAGTKNSNRIIVARYLATGSPLAASAKKITTEIKSASLASLAQNFPNPFSTSTTIYYSIPKQFSSAKIIITDKNGNALKTITLSNNKGSVNIDAATLSSGAYQYSLYVDGKLIASKQMIISK